MAIALDLCYHKVTAEVLAYFTGIQEIQLSERM
jgi:hypothetical protein